MHNQILSLSIYHPDNIKYIYFNDRWCLPKKSVEE